MKFVFFVGVLFSCVGGIFLQQEKDSIHIEATIPNSELQEFLKLSEKLDQILKQDLQQQPKPGKIIKSTDCIPPWLPVEGSCLFVDFDAVVDGTRARNYCKEKHPTADLVVFKDENEFAKILEHIENINIPRKEIHLWIGGEKVNGRWFWVNGKPMKLGSPFWGGDRNDPQPSSFQNEDCALLWFYNRYLIHDAFCNEPSTAALCQYIPA